LSFADENRAARGNTSLESAVLLTKALRRDIQSLGVRLQDAAATEERERIGRKKGHDPDEAKRIILEMKNMMSRIEDVRTQCCCLCCA